MDKIKIGFLLPGLGFIRRGAEQAFVELGRELGKKEDLEIIFYGGGSLEIENTRFVKVPLIKRKFFSSFPKLPFFRNEFQYEDFFYAGGLFFKLLRNPCDVYITCSYPFTFLTLRILKVLRKRFKLCFSTQNGTWFTKKIKEGKLFFCDYIFCTNQIYLNELEKSYHCILAPNGFNPEQLSEGLLDDITQDQNSNHINILCVAALVKEKKVDIVIEAVAKLKNCKLTVVGDGPEFCKLKKIADLKAPGRIIFVGMINHNEIGKYYKKANLFINLKEDEPSALVFYEAMAFGMPIIANDDPIQRWVVGDAGVFLKPKSADELASCILCTLSLADLPQRKETLRTRAYRQFTWQKTAEKIHFFIKSEMKVGEC